MINIITAIGNPRLNIELNKYNEFYTVCSDIQYKEGILEILENNINVDIVVFNSLLAGQISIENLIDEINIINNKIKIIVIIEQKNKEIEDKLISKGVYDFFYNDTELSHIINILKNNNIEIINRELRKEIDNLKLLINEKNNKTLKNKININMLKKRIKTNNKTDYSIQNKKCTTLGIIGINGVGKSSFIYFLSNILSKKNKILILDFNIKNNDLNFFYNLKKEYVEEESFNIKNYLKIINNNLFIISDLNQIINDKKIEFNFLINKINKIKNNYDLVFIDIDLSDNNIKNKTNNEKVLNMCDALIFLALNDSINLKKNERILKNISKNNTENDKKINIILLKNNILNSFFNKKKLKKSLLNNYKIIGKIKYFLLYIFYIKKEKNINYNFLFKIKIKKIINKILLGLNDNLKL